MIIIGELINGMYKDVAKAIANREEDVIQRLAADQAAEGANFLDVNTGPYSKSPKEDMKWLVESIQKKVDIPLALDSTKLDVIEEGLKLVKRRAIINSTNADDDKMDKVFMLAKKYNAQAIGLTMDKSGVPNNKDKRLELAAKILAKSIDYGLKAEDIYLDPIVLPVNVAQTQGAEVLESIREFRLLSDPMPNTVIGLSNVSQGTNLRSLVNRTFLVMAIANGLTAAIMDPLDKELVDASITAELILNKHIYCDSFLNAYRKR
ncbi:MAG: methyltetrahydrofolate--corrinoid methyltransferase [Omnitrophica bacterium RIFCSPLOWO2_01_FULL_45_10]|nr:MAG: methyltetrahydrofolate--corrinoid methyltransferase [Omnitrophica bacterium RIFCSPLOWO2_01_FULL_45_10]